MQLQLLIMEYMITYCLKWQKFINLLILIIYLFLFLKFPKKL